MFEEQKMVYYHKWTAHRVVIFIIIFINCHLICVAHIILQVKPLSAMEVGENDLFEYIIHHNHP